MERIKFYAIFIFVHLFVMNMNGQNWTLTDSGGNTINAAITDSITFENFGGKYVQHIWRDGAVISTSDVEYGATFEMKGEPLEYQEFTYEEDGIDAVVTKDGLYAILKQIPESSDYIFIDGILDDDSREYVLIDENGFIKAIDIGDNNIIQILYTPQTLLLLDPTGEIIGEIPYSELSEDEPEQSRASYTRSRIFKTLQLRNTIKDWLKEPVKKGARDLLRRLSEGYANRYGAILNDLIDLAFDYGDLLAWLEMIDRLEEISYFGNAKVTALDAIKEKICTFKIPCLIEGFYPKLENTMYLSLLNYKFTLGLDVWCDNNISSEKYSEERGVAGNGREEFEFTFQELDELYSYEPHLRIDLDVLVNMDEEYYRRAVLALPNNTTPKPHIQHKSCTIYGNENCLVTGSVGSKVEDVKNAKNTSADIICSFSDVPSGADCSVLVTREGSDFSIVFSGTPNQQSQTVKASGLAPNASYIASTSIRYKGRTYAGTNSVGFRTSGPSGSVTGVSNVKDKTAVIECIFSNVEEAECGIYVKSEDGKTLTFPASNTEGEQSIPVSGLDPCTKYFCTAFVRTSNYYHEDEHSIGFTTNPPDISGPWTCTERHYKFDNINYPYDVSYTLTLNEDGSVTHSEYENLPAGSWSFSTTGEVRISLMTFATQTQNAGIDYTGNVNDVKNPTSITGSNHYWRFNDVVGYVGGDGYSFVMTR